MGTADNGVEVVSLTVSVDMLDAVVAAILKPRDAFGEPVGIVEVVRPTALRPGRLARPDDLRPAEPRDCRDSSTASPTPTATNSQTTYNARSAARRSGQP